MPGQLKEVRSRIGAVKSTQKITKAMKLVAASKLRKAQDRIISMRPYANKLAQLLSNIVSGTETNVEIPLAKAREVNKVLLVVLTSDRGLCGGFNANMVKLAKRTIAEKYQSQYDAGNVFIVGVGKKGYETLRKDNKLEANGDYVDLFTRLDFDNVAPLAEMVMDGFLSGQWDVVEVVYNQFKNQITQLPVVSQYLPIAQMTKDTSQNKGDGNTMNDFIYQPNPEDIILELVPKILKTQFYRYLLDSNASEHGARMTAMDNATENAEELLRELKIMYNRARQAAITTELTEIVSGAAALNG